MFHFSLLFENSIKNVSKTKQKSFLSTKILGKNDYGYEGLVWIFESNFVFAEFSTIAKKYKNVAK